MDNILLRNVSRLQMAGYEASKTIAVSCSSTTHGRLYNLCLYQLVATCLVNNTDCSMMRGRIKGTASYSILYMARFSVPLSVTCANISVDLCHYQ